ncbi:MAG: amidohydrolase family protein [Candidatus Eiseniibacteriota bacterium]|nr:MAG: amidohydrolase family protein [Candidatus Eisenbacteria bacterium]
MNRKREVLKGDVLVRDGAIAAVGRNLEAPGGQAERVINAEGCCVLPGFVQTHVHLCQTLFRGVVEDVGLGKWLDRIWKLEAAHDERSMYCSAMVGCCELLRSGTTCVLDMGSVHHTDEVFRALLESGIRAIGGKAMMDSGDAVPAGLRESTRESLEESLRLHSQWHGAGEGRIGYALAPRFMESCSEELLRRVSENAGELDLLVHSHSSETRDEVAACKAQRGLTPPAYLNSVGLAAGNVVLAHCVHLELDDLRILSETGTKVSHCPSSNLKLSSGIADIGGIVRAGVKISLGCDGAACNNNLDMLLEMRLASLLQSYLNRDDFPWASLFLEAATIRGAEALGKSQEIGSIEPGKRADIITVDLSSPHTLCGEDCEPSSRLVFSARGSDVQTVVVNGRVLLEEGRLVFTDEERLLAKSSEELAKLLARCQ